MSITCYNITYIYVRKKGGKSKEGRKYGGSHRVGAQQFECSTSTHETQDLNVVESTSLDPPAAQQTVALADVLASKTCDGIK